MAVASELWAGERETFTFRAGVLFFDAEGSVGSTRSKLPPMDVALEDVGIDEDRDRSFWSASWNVTDRWVLRLDSFSFDSNGTSTASRTFSYNDTVVTVGAEVAAKLDLQIYLVNLGYRFMDRDRWEVGAGVGVHYIDLAYGLSARLRANDDEVSVSRETTSQKFPVPNLYTWTRYSLSDRLWLNVHGGWLSANYGDYDGRLYFLRAALEFDVGEHFGIGGGYWVTDFDVERETSSVAQRFNLNLPGPQVYVKFQF